MSIANEPDLLIADEPTTALDVTIQFQILELLQNIQNKMGMSMIFISHDLSVVKKLSDYIYVMKNGKVIERKFYYDDDLESMNDSPKGSGTSMNVGFGFRYIIDPG